MRARVRSHAISVVLFLLVAPGLSRAPLAQTVIARPAGQVTRARAPLNLPPQITASLPAGTVVRVGEELCFTVTVVDPEGDPVDVRMLRTPPGLTFHPALSAAPPSVHDVRWLVPESSGGVQTLHFSAEDGVSAQGPSVAAVQIRVAALSSRSAIQIGDVTGDGVLDVVAGASMADVGGVANTGAIYVWAGQSVPSGTPTATLTVPGAAASDGLGLGVGQAIQLADVTGDGVHDVVASAVLADVGGVPSAGAIYVWAGGPGLTGAPALHAVLSVPGAAAGDTLGQGFGQGIQLADVTGDGAADVVASAYLADVGGVSSTGAIYVWAGGVGLAGALPPSATLTVPGATIGDALGETDFGQGVQLADVTHDGVLDVVAAAVLADVAGVVDAGAVHVWAGGPGLAGAPPPGATLVVPGAAAGDMLGRVGPGHGIQLADVTGDGATDLVVGAERADVGGVANAGAVYVWAGGPGLSGTLAPDATLTVPGATTDDFLGNGGSPPGLLLADVTDDGTRDVVVGAHLADVSGVLDAGAIYVWAGGPGLSGALGPSATLTVPGAAPSDQLGRVGGLDHGTLLHDVTGDGALDVVAGATGADVGGVVGTGAIYVWAGGPGLSGALAPSATLTVPGAVAGDELGWASSGQGIQIVDLTGDGQLDVIAGAPRADVGGVTDAGAIYVWAGGPGLSGALRPGAALTVPGAVAGDFLGQVFDGQGISFADVTGGGFLDVVAGAAIADVGGVVDAGAVYVWAGGPGLSGAPPPSATLVVPGAVAGDSLGRTASDGQGIQLAEVTGDGAVDVVVGTSLADVGGVAQNGAFYVWSGGPGLSGSPAPSATLTVPGALAGDLLGQTFVGHGMPLGDVTGDGLLDIVGGAPRADVGGVTDAGAIYAWPGGSGLSGPVGPAATLSVPGAAAADQLGR